MLQAHSQDAAGQRLPKVHAESTQQSYNARCADATELDTEGQHALFWLNGKHVAVSMDAHGMHLEHLETNRQQQEQSAAGSTLKYVPYNEILCARYLPIKRYCISLPRKQRKHHFMELQVLRRHPGRPWQWGLSSMQLSAEHANAAKQLVLHIQARLQQLTQRPRELLVFVNPYGGRRQAPRIWNKVAAPVLAAAGVQCHVIETTYQGHAESVIRGLTMDQLRQFDGVVAVGGDGMFSELLTAVLQQQHLQQALELRLAHIPAGSTDAVACTLHGTRDALTAVLHIALGDCTPLDVARLVTLDPVPAPAVEAVPPSSAAAAAAGLLPGTSAGEETQLWRSTNSSTAATVDKVGHEQGRQQQRGHQSRHERRRRQQQQRHQQQQHQQQQQQQQFVPKLRHFVCVASYGFLGDVMETSERLRWIGPVRYDVAGVLRFLFLRGYKATVWYKPAAAAGLEQGPGGSSSTLQQQQQGSIITEPLAAPAALAPLLHRSSTPTLHAAPPAYDHTHHLYYQQQQQQLISSVESHLAQAPASADVSSNSSNSIEPTAWCSSSPITAAYEPTEVHSYPSTPATAVTPEPHGSSHLAHLRAPNAAAVATAAGGGALVSDSQQQSCKATGPKSAGAAAAAVHAIADSVSSMSSSLAATNPGILTRSCSTTSSSQCRSGCSLCGAAAMQRSSSRQLFVVESQPQVAAPADDSTPEPTAGNAAAAAGASSDASVPAAAAATDAACPPGPGWLKAEGKYSSIMCVVTSCRSDKSKSGVCPAAHLADGRLVLVLVEKRSRLQHLRFLLQLATTGVVPGTLPHVKVEYVSEVQVHTHGRQSHWNIDGELLSHPCVHVGVHAGLVDVFARGVELT